MQYTVEFLPKFAQEFGNFPEEHQNKVLDFIRTFQIHGLSDFSIYEGKIAPSWVSGSPEYHFARSNKAPWTGTAILQRFFSIVFHRKVSITKNGLLKVNFKVNMSIRFLEINERTLGKPSGASPGRSLLPWRLLARCEGDTAGSCVLITHLQELAAANRKDGKSALSALDKLIKVAATGQPIENFYDAKQSHPLHEFVYKERNRVIWRIRKSDVRIAFYYAEGKIIFLADVFAKRKDKLTKGEKKQLEDEVKAYIDAEDGQQLVVISQQGE